MNDDNVIILFLKTIESTDCRAVTRRLSGLQLLSVGENDCRNGTCTGKKTTILLLLSFTLLEYKVLSNKKSSPTSDRPVIGVSVAAFVVFWM